MSINSTVSTPGRFGNHIFRNLALHFLSLNNNIKFTYSYLNEFNELGIELYSSGLNTYDEYINIDDSNFFYYIKNNVKFNKNINLKEMYAQTEEFAFYIKKYIYQEEQKNKIITNNLFKERYNNNNDVFLHIRLGDVVHHNPGFVYYDSILFNLQFENGYVSSDLLDHPMCIALINKYNLKTVKDTEVKTIMFGSTCKTIILSNGTFSWTVGLLGFYSKIYYPKIKNNWHGNIFVFPEWNQVDTSNSVPPLPYELAKKMLTKYKIKY
jgi:hypothetical protein